MDIDIVNILVLVRLDKIYRKENGKKFLWGIKKGDVVCIMRV